MHEYECINLGIIRFIFICILNCLFYTKSWRFKDIYDFLLIYYLSSNNFVN